MDLHVVEATNGFNWGKFAVSRFGPTEWAWRSSIDTESTRPLLAQRGWSRDHLWVFDLQTGEAALFRPGGNAHADLNNHRIWVCPMFEPFLAWLWRQDLDDLTKLPNLVTLDAPAEFAGYRRPGPPEAQSGAT